MRVVSAALLYFLIVFGAGFAFGTVRTLALEPALGRFLAVLIEIPFMLLAMIVGARIIPPRMGLVGARGALIAMGLGALVLQQIADILVGQFLRGMTLAEQYAQFATPAGLAYGFGLVMFVAMPLIIDLLRARR